MKNKTILGLVFSLVVLLAASAVQADDCGYWCSGLPVVIEEVEIDGTEVVWDEENSLSLERGQDIDVKVKMYATEDVENVELMAYISGYEHSDVEPISDTTAVFDMDANVTYIKKLQLSLPSRADEDTYKLRLVIADRSGDECTPNYLIKLLKTEVALRQRLYRSEFFPRNFGTALLQKFCAQAVPDIPSSGTACLLLLFRKPYKF